MAELKLFNTRSRKLETFHPLHDQQVGLYTCGPTVYSSAHLGNLRTYIFDDVLRRTLEFNDYSVNQVMNVTDVGHLTDDADMGEDKMEASARQQKKSAQDIAKFHTQEFFDDLKRLNIEPPSVVLNATDTIDLQIDLINKLEAKGVTYHISDGIYFDTSKFPSYGQLSGQKSHDKQAGARVEVNTEKKHPSDFALWKFSKPEDKRQMEWSSPWGTGFPGWHIECSAMSMKELGEQFDIHTGGVDHIAVHHENEIAQSEAATGKHPFVNIWMHGEFLVLPGKRMGKSEGNKITLQDVIEKKIDPLAYRYLVLQAHYRKQLSFTWESLHAAAEGLHRLWNTIAGLPSTGGKVNRSFIGAFRNAINDDLNTATGLATVQTLLQSDLKPADIAATLERIDTVLALDLTPVAAKKHVGVDEADFDTLIEEYEVARAEKRYAVSDQIRKQIEAKGAVVEDLPDGTTRLRKK